MNNSIYVLLILNAFVWVVALITIIATHRPETISITCYVPNVSIYKDYVCTGGFLNG